MRYLIISNGCGAGHAVRDLVLADEIRRRSDGAEIYFASYAAGLSVFHSIGETVIDLKQEERSKMDLWAKAMKYINEVVDEKGLSLALEFIQSNTTIPVVVTDANLAAPVRHVGPGNVGLLHIGGRFFVGGMRYVEDGCEGWIEPAVKHVERRAA